MDSWLVFQHRRWLVTVKGGHSKVGGAYPLDMVRPRPEAMSRVGKPPGAFELRGGGSQGATRGHPAEPILSRKVSWPEPRRPYRKPTPVGGGKYPEVIERTLVKELGKLTP